MYPSCDLITFSDIYGYEIKHSEMYYIHLKCHSAAMMKSDLHLEFNYTLSVWNVSRLPDQEILNGN